MNFRLKSSSLLFVVAGLAACAHRPPGLPPMNAPSISPPAQSSSTSEAMALVLAGELAARRGQLAQAATQLLRAAELSADARLADRATRLAFAAEDFALADRAGRVWLSLAADDGTARNLALRAQIASGRAELADLQAWLRDNGDDEQAEQQLAALIAAASPDSAQALQLLRDLEAARQSPGLAYALGSLALRFADPQTALDALQRAREGGWSARACDELLLRIHLVQGNEPAARTVLDALRGALREDRNAALALGQSLLEAEAWELAEAHFNWVQAQWPGDVGSRLALGLLAVQNGADDTAREHFQALWAEGSRGDEAALQLGRLEGRQGNWEAAQQWFGRVGQGRRWADATLGQARALAELKQLEQARSLLEALRFSDPDRVVSAWQAEAELLERAGKVDVALEVLDRGIAQTDSLDLLYRRALMRDGAGDFQAAAADLEAILARDPENPHALNALGYMLADRNLELGRAQTLIERALAARPNDPAIRDSLGWVLYRRGQLQSALIELRAAYAAYPDPEVAAHLGEVLWAAGQRDEARQIWTQALQDDPEHPTLLATWKRFTEQ